MQYDQYSYFINRVSIVFFYLIEFYDSKQEGRYLALDAKVYIDHRWAGLVFDRPSVDPLSDLI